MENNETYIPDDELLEIGLLALALRLCDLHPLVAMDPSTGDLVRQCPIDEKVGRRALQENDRLKAELAWGIPDERPWLVDMIDNIEQALDDHFAGNCTYLVPAPQD